MTRMNGVDLNLFPFDYDLTWFSFFMDAELGIYSRYGGRAADSAEGRISAKGLLYVMDEVLKLHSAVKDNIVPSRKRQSPRLADELPGMKTLLEGHKDGCIHCHMVKDVQYADLQKQGKLRKESLWIDPLPDTIGVLLDVDRGTHIAKLTPGSFAVKAGLRVGDRITTADGLRTVSAYDLQAALDGIPATGKIPLKVVRDRKEVQATVEVSGNWRFGDISWRKSIRELSPSAGFYGRAISDSEKKEYRIGAQQLGFHLTWVGPNSPAGKGGLRAGDVIVAVDDKRELPYIQLRSYFPLEHKSGDKVRVIYLRDSKEVTTTLELP